MNKDKKNQPESSDIDETGEKPYYIYSNIKKKKKCRIIIKDDNENENNEHQSKSNSYSTTTTTTNKLNIPINKCLLTERRRSNSENNIDNLKPKVPNPDLDTNKALKTFEDLMGQNYNVTDEDLLKYRNLFTLG